MESQSEMWTVVIIGLGTVFLCLISLVVMISLFKRLFVGTEKKAVEAKPLQQVINQSSNIDGNIVAAIVAAIAASTSMSPSSFSIASIEPSVGFNTPVWGHINRAVKADNTFRR